jgi:hypothetical protein
MESPSSPNRWLSLHTHTAPLLNQLLRNLLLNLLRWVNPVTWIARPAQPARLDNKNAKEAPSNLTAKKIPQ